MQIANAILLVCEIILIVIGIRALIRQRIDTVVAQKTAVLQDKLNDTINHVNQAFQNVVNRVNEIAARVNGNQSKLDKFIDEIGHNGVEIGLSNVIERVDALEDYHKIKLVPKYKEETKTVHDGVGYTKVTKKDKETLNGCNLSF